MDNKKISVLIEDVRENTPYPADIFIEPTKEEYKKMREALKSVGLTPDKFFGSHGRQVWDNCLNEIILRLKDE